MQLNVRLAKFLKVVTNLSTLVLLITVAACGGSSGSGGSTPPDPQAINLGILDNSGGAAIMSSSGSYTLSGNQYTTGTVSIRGGTPGFTGTLTVSVSHIPSLSTSNSLSQNSASALPTVDLSNCTLTAGNSNQLICKYTISTTVAVPNGNYSIIPTFTATQTGHVQQLNAIKLTIIGGATPTAGELSIITNSESLIVNESTTATVTLSGSIGIFESINVAITSTNPNILTVTPISCRLSTDSNNCQVTITGLAAGSANISASASGYQTVQTILTAASIKSYVYVANSGGTISMYGINPNTGRLMPTNPASVVSHYEAQDIIADPTGHYVYANSFDDNTILMYSINQSTGVLAPLSPATILVESSHPNYLAIDPSGQYLYATTSGNNSLTTISMFRIESNTGQLIPLNPTTVFAGYGPTGITIDPSGRYLYALDSVLDHVLMYNLESSTGLLTPLSPEAVATGNDPEGVAIDPTGRYVYVANYGNNTVSMYTIEHSSGLLRPLNPATVPAGYKPIWVTVDPTGQYVYVTNRGDNSISMYRVELSTGLLTPLSPTAITTISKPWGVIVDPTGQYTYLTNDASNTVEMYGINQSTGILTELNPTTVVAGTIPLGITIATPRVNNILAPLK